MMMCGKRQDGGVYREMRLGSGSEQEGVWKRDKEKEKSRGKESVVLFPDIPRSHFDETVTLDIEVT
jgi:hypothetical protein